MTQRTGFSMNFPGFGLNYYNETIGANAPPAAQQPAIADTCSVPVSETAVANNTRSVPVSETAAANNTRSVPVSETAAANRNNTSSKVIAFYKNEIPSQPNGALIKNILYDWSGDYEKLDNFSHYIQWLFPGRKGGTNPQAPLLTDEDVEIIMSAELKNRAMRAFAMMLDFYGMKLNTNTIDLTPNHKERLQKIMSNVKYYMVISRILSFLKELGEQKLMITWLKFLADLIQKHLLDEDAKISFNSYWIKTLNKNGFDEVKGYIKQINRN